MERTVTGQEKRMECRPFVRLFRRCEDGRGDGKGGKGFFHVETTAWEGEHMWTPPEDGQAGKGNASGNPTEEMRQVEGKQDQVAQYGKSFWTKGS